MYLESFFIQQSRAPSSSEQHDTRLQEEAEVVMEVCVAHLFASTERLFEYQRQQAEDHICSTIINYCRTGWPEKNDVGADLGPYWKARGELTVDKNNLLLYGKCIFVPKSLQKQTLEKLHTGHQGVKRCRLHANTSVWWPGLSHEVENMVKQCQRCARDYIPRKEPMIPTEVPDYLWQKIGTDLFHLKGATYLVVIDYFSRYPEVQRLPSIISQKVIEVLKTVFSHHGIPEVVISVNGPQFTSQECTQFATKYTCMTSGT